MVFRFKRNKVKTESCAVLQVREQDTEISRVNLFSNIKDAQAALKEITEDILGVKWSNVKVLKDPGDPSRILYGYEGCFEAAIFPVNIYSYDQWRTLTNG